MSGRHYILAAILASAVSGVSIVLSWHPPRPRLLWNATASAPIGLYAIAPGAGVQIGALVAVQPPPDVARFLGARHYLPIGVPLLKHIAALSGSRICRYGPQVTIDGRLSAIARMRDSHGRPLPVWHGCRVLQDPDLFVLNATPDSMDSRYFGPIPRAGLVGRATPIATRDAPNAPLRWRLTHSRTAPSVPPKGDQSCNEA